MKDKQYIELLRERLLPERFTHSLNVAQSAVYLAEKYGEDKDKAYIAGLLHDVMKNSDDTEQLEMIERYGISMTELEKKNKKLWHAMSAPGYLLYELGEKDEDLLNAVRYHTTGRAGMSLLERIIFIADYISDERDYNGVEIMRELADKSLEDAMLFALKFTLQKLSSQNMCIHPDCLGCYNELIINR